VSEGRLVDVGDVGIYVVERGDGYPVLCLHGGPGLDHAMWADYLDALTDEFRLVLVDQRANGRSDKGPKESWSLEQHATDVVGLADSLGFEKYAVLGHSYGAIVALQNAVSHPGAAAQSIISSGVGARRYLDDVWRRLDEFEPVELREQVTWSWKRETEVQTPEEFAEITHAQLPMQFGDPFDPRIREYEERTAHGIYSPDVLRHFAAEGYGGIDVEDRLGRITQPVLVLTGRMDRTCPPEAAEAIGRGVPNAELRVFENSGHMTFVEENEAYVLAVRDFLNRHTANTG
jgi:proline-specific peptidase